MFKDEQRRILSEILASAREDLESRFRLITERYAPLMKFLQGAGAPVPGGLQTAWDLTLHNDIRRQLSNGHTDPEQLKSLLKDAANRGAEVLNADISYAVKMRLERMMRELTEHPENVAQIRETERLAALVTPLPIGLNLAEVQNTWWAMRKEIVPDLQRQVESEEAKNRVEAFRALGDRLGFAPGALERAAGDAPVPAAEAA